MGFYLLFFFFRFSIGHKSLLMTSPLAAWRQQMDARVMTQTMKTHPPPTDDPMMMSKGSASATELEARRQS